MPFVNRRLIVQTIILELRNSPSLRYRLLGRRRDPPGLGRPFVSPASNRNIDAASPPVFTAEVTIRANAHTEQKKFQHEIETEK